MSTSGVKLNVKYLIVSLVILIVLYKIGNPHEIATTLSHINTKYFISSILLYILASIFVALALQFSIASSGERPPTLKVVMASFAGQLLSDITPMRSGYFTTPYFLSKMGATSLERGISGVFLVGIVNSLTKALIGSLAAVYIVWRVNIYDSLLSRVIIYSSVIGVFMLLFIALALYVVLFDNRRIVSLLRKLPYIGEKALSLAGNVKIDKEYLDRRYLVYSSMMIIASVIVNGLATMAVLKSINPAHNLRILDFIFIASITPLFIYAPYTIAGLGLQETGYAALAVALYGIPVNEAVTFAFLARILFTGTDVIGLPVIAKYLAGAKDAGDSEASGLYKPSSKLASLSRNTG